MFLLVLVENFIYIFDEMFLQFCGITLKEVNSRNNEYRYIYWLPDNFQSSLMMYDYVKHVCEYHIWKAFAIGRFTMLYFVVVFYHIIIRQCSTVKHFDIDANTTKHISITKQHRKKTDDTMCYKMYWMRELQEKSYKVFTVLYCIIH